MSVLKALRQRIAPELNFRCAAGGGKSIRNRPTREEAVAWIADNYAEPQAEILRLLKA
ncbi:MAG: hypothetical protein HY736_26760 [Verrucomicrobia bacterium]|nr:hypothetical protein [Verrucomicrobiota bacterium]